MAFFTIREYIILNFFTRTYFQHFQLSAKLIIKDSPANPRLSLFLFNNYFKSVSTFSSKRFV